MSKRPALSLSLSRESVPAHEGAERPQSPFENSVKLHQAVGEYLWSTLQVVALASFQTGSQTPFRLTIPSVRNFQNALALNTSRSKVRTNILRSKSSDQLRA